MLKTLFPLFLLTSMAAADVTLVSAFAGDVQIRLGDREEGLGPRQSLTLTLPASSGPLTVLDGEGKTLYQASLGDNRFWVLSPQGAQEAGLVKPPSGSPRCAVSFFNSSPYTIVLNLSAEKIDPDPNPIRVLSMQLSPPMDIPSATFNISLQDEVGNPIGKSYSRVRGGQCFLVYRKRDTLYDLEALGTIPVTKP